MRQAIVLVLFLVAAFAASQYLKKSDDSSRDSSANESPEEHAAHSEQSLEQKTEPVSGVRKAEASVVAQPSARDQAFAKAVELIGSKSYKDAAEVLEGLLKENPRDEKALEAMGRLKLRAMEQPEEAVGYFQRAIAENANNTRALNGLVLAYQTSQNPAAAEKALLELEAKNPRSAGVSEVLGGVYSERGDFKKANEYFRKAASLSDMPEYPLGALADSLRGQGKPAEAAKTYHEILSIHQRNLSRNLPEGEKVAIQMEVAMTSMDLADTLIDQGRFEEAERLLEQVRSEHAEAPVEKLYEKLDRVKGS